MYSFAGSYDARYFVCKKGTELQLLRFENILMRKTVDNEESVILGVGNNGNIVVQTDEGIMIYYYSDQEQMDFLEPFSKGKLFAQSASINKICLKDTGTQLCIEKVSTESKLTKKIWSALKPGLKDQELHEIIFYSISEKKYDTYHKFSHPSNLETKFIWDISKTFNYMITGEPHKAGNSIKMKFTIVYVDTYESYHEFHLVNPRVNRLLINDYGIALLDMYGERGKELLIVTSEGKRYTIAPPSEYNILHLGKNFVALLTHPIPTLIIKSFEDILLCAAELKSLDELGIPYFISFNIKDEIDIIHVINNEVKIQNSGVDRIQIDAKRWALLAKHVRDSSELVPQEEQKIEKKKISMDELTKQKEDQEETVLYGEVADRREMSKTLEMIKLQFITGQITEEEYMRKKDELEKDLTYIESKGIIGEKDLEKKTTLTEIEESGYESMKSSFKEEEHLMPVIATPSPIRLEKHPAQKEAVTTPTQEETPAQKEAVTTPTQEETPAQKEIVPATAERDESPIEEKASNTEESMISSIKERERIERLLLALEERFIVGEVSEDTYKQLKNKYTRMLKTLD